MKRVFMSILLIVAVAGIAFAQAPQTQAENPTKIEGQGAQHAEKKELMDIRLQIIKTELELSDEVFVKFAPIYRQYYHNLNFNRTKSQKIDIETATRKDINDHLKARYDNQISMAMVHKTYIFIFERVLTPQQLYKLYSIDGKLTKMAREEYKKRQEK